MAASLTITGKAPAARNGIAAALATPAFRKRVVRAKAGKGSYTRKAKHKASQGW
jgi:stalled ribosome alternative rescue factor ArfA